MMNLIRVSAFAVLPQRKADGTTPASGGSLRVNADIQTALNEAFRKAKLGQQAPVDFRVDPSTRTNPMRDLVIKFAYGTRNEPREAALAIAAKLAKSMDERSPSTLLLLAAEEDGSSIRRMTIWAFPRDESFQFHNTSRGTVLKLLQDTFSRNSNLRKAALFEGRQIKSDFLTGRVLDHQSGHGHRRAADYWIDAFLDCTLGLKGEAGTRILARCLQEAFEATDDGPTRENLYAAMMTARHSNKRRISLKKFAHDHLKPAAQKLFLAAAPNTETISATFDFQHEVFDRTLNFRVFRLKSDVYVSAPFGTIGNSVVLSGVDERQLTCHGTIVEERVKARHG